MQNIQQIIVPVDFHQHTEDLAAFAIGIANKLEAKLTFLNVSRIMAEGASYSDVVPTSFAAVDEELFGYAQKKMTNLVEKSKSTCPGCTGVVLKGEVADAIVDYVSDKNCDMIIMATHGAQGIEKILLGSVAERVLKRASCPVLIFNPYKGERGYQISSPINEILQPV